MKIKKLKFDGMDSFNDYSVEMSYGQLVALRNALEKDHSDPLSDELYAELNYYLQNIPGPGENSDEFKAERDASKKTPEEAGTETAPENAPASDTEIESGKLPPPPSEEPFSNDGGEEGGEFQEGPKLSPEERDIIDRAMPAGRTTGPGAERGPLGRAKAAILPPPPNY